MESRKLSKPEFPTLYLHDTELLDSGHLAAYLALPLERLAVMAGRYRLPVPTLIGGAFRWRVKNVDKWLAELPEGERRFLEEEWVKSKNIPAGVIGYNALSRLLRIHPQSLRSMQLPPHFMTVSGEPFWPFWSIQRWWLEVVDDTFFESETGKRLCEHCKKGVQTPYGLICSAFEFEDEEGAK